MKLIQAKLETVLKIFLGFDTRDSIERNSRRLDMTYVTLLSHMNDLKRLGIIHMEKVGRRHSVKFTLQGVQIRQRLFEIRGLLDGNLINK